MKRRVFLHNLGLTSLVPLVGAGSALAEERRGVESPKEVSGDDFRDFISSIEQGGDSTAAFQKFENNISGRRIDLGGRRIEIRRVPSGNLYVNGFFLTELGEIEAAESAAVISALSDTGADDAPYKGGKRGNSVVSGRSTFYNKVLIASTNCRAMFVRSVVVASIYTWVKSNLGLAAASRQCIVNGPQASTISAEESRSFGFRSFNYGAIFSTATVSTGGNIATRHAETSGSYVVNLGSNTTRIGRGYGAELKVVVRGGKVIHIEVVKPGRGYREKECQLEVDDRSGRGRGCKATLNFGRGGRIESIKISNGGIKYSENTEALVIQKVSSSVVMASSNSQLYYSTNALIASSAKSRVSGDFATVLSSFRSGAKRERATVIASADSHAIGEGAVVIGAERSTSLANGAVVFGDRVISNVPNSLSFGFAESGKPTVENVKFRVDSKGGVYSVGGFKGAAGARGYAEFFENERLGELPLGLIVTESAGKVSICKDGDAIFGVRAQTGLLVGGGEDFYWSEKYLRGDFDEYLYEDVDMVRHLDSSSKVVYEGREGEGGRSESVKGLRVEKYVLKVPKINPAYEESKKYIPRRERKDEWSEVVLVGSVKVRVERNVKVGDYLWAINGVGNVSDRKTRLKCMRVVSEFDEGKGYSVAICMLL